MEIKEILEKDLRKR